MLHAILLTVFAVPLAETPAAEKPPEWVIFNRNVVAGTIPQLVPPPANLPVPRVTSEGVLLPRPLDGYVAAELVALRLYPALAQKALDDAVEARDKACAVELADAKAAEPTTMDRLRTDLLWGVGGVVVGAIATGFLVGYLKH